LRVINALKLASTSSDERLIKAVEFLLQNAHRRGVLLLAEVDLSFTSETWRKLVFVEHNNQTKMVRRHLEVCLFSYLAAQLKSGDICVFGSESYADYRLQLLTWSECELLVGEYCQNLDFPTDALTLKANCYKSLHRVKFYTYPLFTPARARESLVNPPSGALIKTWVG